MKRKYCYLCGGEVSTKDDYVYMCGSCGQSYYDNPKPCVEIVLFNDSGQVLLSKRAVEPYKGKFDLPGGFVDKGDTLEEAIIREVKEEIGIDTGQLKDLRYVSSYKAFYPWGKEIFHNVIAEFTATVSNDIQVQGMDDVELVEWVDMDDLNKYDYSIPEVPMMIKLALERGQRC